MPAAEGQLTPELALAVLELDMVADALVDEGLGVTLVDEELEMTGATGATGELVAGELVAGELVAGFDTALDGAPELVAGFDPTLLDGLGGA